MQEPVANQNCMLLIDVDNLQQLHYVYEACHTIHTCYGNQTISIAVGPGPKIEKLKDLSKQFNLKLRYSSQQVKQSADRLIASICAKRASRYQRAIRDGVEKPEASHKPKMVIASSDKDFFKLSRYMQSKGFETVCITREFAIPNDAAIYYDKVFGMTGNMKRQFLNR